MFSSIRTLDISIAFVGFILTWHLFRRTRRSIAPLPPGPRGLPLIGNLLDMPSEKEWLTYAKWGEKYGTVSLGENLAIMITVYYKATSHGFQALDNR